MAKQLSDYDSEGTCLGQDSSDKIGFYGETPAARRTGTFTTVTTTAASNTTDAWGFTTSTQANGIVSTLNEVVAVLVASGLRGAT